MGDTDLARFLVNKLNIVTIPWLDTVNSLTSYLYEHIQPYSQISVYWLPVIASLVTLGSYIYFNQDSPFVNDLRAVWFIIKNNWARLQETWLFTSLVTPFIVRPFNWIKNNSKNIVWFLCIPTPLRGGLARFIFNCSWSLLGTILNGTVEVIKFIFRPQPINLFT